MRGKRLLAVALAGALSVTACGGEEVEEIAAATLTWLWWWQFLGLWQARNSESMWNRLRARASKSDPAPVGR